MFKSKDEKLRKIIDKLPDNLTLTKEILKLVRNDTTQIKQEKDFKDSYYVYLKDTIYLADNEKSNGENRLCLIAHECRHSVQSKLLQKINFILSNIYIVVSIVCLLLVFFIRGNFLIYSYLIFSSLSIIPRIVLEVDAVLSSTKIAGKYLELKVNEEERKLIISNYIYKTRTFLPLFILSLFSSRIICTICLIVINCFIGG